MPGKNKLVYNREEPAFLKRMKQQAGYKEECSVDEKRQKLEEATRHDTLDREQEQPVVVQLPESEITQQEAELFIVSQVGDDEKDDKDSKKIVFKKPRKSRRKSDENREKKSLPVKSKSKAVNDNRLLSFEDEEEDDGGG